MSKKTKTESKAWAFTATAYDYDGNRHELGTFITRNYDMQSAKEKVLFAIKQRDQQYKDYEVSMYCEGIWVS